MAVGKIGGILLVLIILGSIGFFGAHFESDITGTTTLDRPDETGLSDAMGFLFQVGTLQIENAPVWLSLIVDILIIAFLILLASMFIPLIPG
jgi:hypothetical protein